jgi:hypothetical protein
VHRITLFILALVIIGCDQRIPQSGNVPLSEKARLSEDGLTGIVLEQIAAPPYLYLRLKTEKGETWAAVDGGSVKKGSRVTVSGAMLMKNFESTSLKRTFPEVYFGTLGSPGLDAASAPKNPHATGVPTSERIELLKIERATSANARTVAEAWAQREGLNGKSVTIRGLVVKFTEGVMEKNWLHLQDGSGAVSQGDFDITVTTLDKVTAGDTVTVTGTVRTDQQVGAGYAYPVLVENAKVIRK